MFHDTGVRLNRVGCLFMFIPLMFLTYLTISLMLKLFNFFDVFYKIEKS